MQIIQWKPVVGFEHAYEVSSAGEVRSIDRTLPVTRIVNGKPVHTLRRLRGRLLRPGTVDSGHQLVVLGRGNSRLIHALVLTAFVGPKPDGMEGCHRDGDPAHNALDNLRWGTRSDNVIDMLDHGRSRSGLSTADVVEMRRLCPTMRNVDIAKMFGINQSHVSLIRNGRSWTHAQ